MDIPTLALGASIGVMCSGALVVGILKWFYVNEPPDEAPPEFSPLWMRNRIELLEVDVAAKQAAADAAWAEVWKLKKQLKRAKLELDSARKAPSLRVVK